MAHYGPMKPESLTKRRATVAGKPWGFARWTPEERTAVQRQGVIAAKEARALRAAWRRHGV